MSLKEGAAAREAKNKSALKYYHANRDKVLTQRKQKRTAERASECAKKGLPEYLGKYITFAIDGTLTLRFENVNECRKVLHWLKFKSEYGEDIKQAIVEDKQ